MTDYKNRYFQEDIQFIKDMQSYLAYFSHLSAWKYTFTLNDKARKCMDEIVGLIRVDIKNLKKHLKEDYPNEFIPTNYAQGVGHSTRPGKNFIEAWEKSRIADNLTPSIEQEDLGAAERENDSNWGKDFAG